MGPLPLIRAGALALLCCRSVQSFACIGQARLRTSAFVPSAVTAPAMSRKRPRGGLRATAGFTTPVIARPAALLASPTALGGSFVPRSPARQRERLGPRCGRSRSREVARRTRRGGLTLGIVFHPPDLDTIVSSFAQAIVLGVVGGGLIPKWTRERIREKEAGLEADELYEMGWDKDGGDLDSGFGEGRSYVCNTCDNTNEVDCSKCRGKGFFVSDSALPRKCGYCGGLGTLDCPDCAERRERLRQARARRIPLRRLPPARENDFPYGQ